MTSDLEQTGKVRVYGINFDSDSDHLRDESHTTLDQIVAMLKAKPDWKLTVEGHTDATSTPEHNQQLSERRANSVKAYLVAAGIDAHVFRQWVTAPLDPWRRMIRGWACPKQARRTCEDVALGPLG